MEPGNNAAALRVGLVADDLHAARLIAAVLGCEGLVLAGQAGMPRERAAGEAPWFDDERVLLAQGDVDGLLVVTAPRLAGELIQAAAGRRKPVWCLPPAGCDFADLTQSVRVIRGPRTTGRIASWWDHVAEHVGWALERSATFEVHSGELFVSAPPVAANHWTADRVAAGGGVLLHECYELLECLLAVLGLPESVHAATGRTRQRDPSGAATEDLALGILRFAGGTVIGLRGARGVPPYVARLSLHGPDYSVRLTPDRLAVVDAAGSVRESRMLPGAWLARELDLFAEQVRGQIDARSAQTTQERHVAMAAVMEAMYLSSRTGQLESPRSFYEVQKWPEPPSGSFAERPRSS